MSKREMTRDRERATYDTVAKAAGTLTQGSQNSN